MSDDTLPSDTPASDSTTGLEDGVHRELSYPVVGIGASAGGLEAFSDLLKALPTDTGMSFVFVPHLSPTHNSMMAEILGRLTSMPVIEVSDEPSVQPNTIYVIPPGRSMIIVGGKLQLFPREATPGGRHGIDQFLHSLAEDQTYTAIGVILSGTGNDGSVGVSEIKQLGGITFAQDSSAQYDSMPLSAIKTGCIDFVLSPAGIAAELARIARHPYVANADVNDSRVIDAADVPRVLQLVQQGMGVDFSQYKRNTLYRRITRRMVLHKLERLSDYVTLLQGDPREVEALYNDILINVTSFFRNPEAYEALKSKIFPQLTQNRSRHDPIRIWVLGCSSGEEAYSLAIALSEYASVTGRNFPLQIFATDLDAAGIEHARSGVYPRTIAEEVSPERLRRFFIETDGSYRIAKPIRDMCVFAPHNGVADPPFSHMDLISCRNLLIYFEQSLQQRVLPMLHYALEPGGYLWLGQSETIGAYRDYFAVADAHHKIYSKLPTSNRLTTTTFQPLVRAHPAAERTVPVRLPGPATPDLTKEADRVLLNRYTPPSVLVNSELEILHFRGDTGDYLAPTPGKASLSLLKMLREGLVAGVRSAINTARDREHPVVREEDLRVRTASGFRSVNIEVVLITGATPREDCFLVLFEDPEGHLRFREPAVAVDSGGESDVARDLSHLSQELASTKEYLQNVIEQQEAANEELQSANEEVQSANEELQSINEELETSKEEIQSSNEELATVNDELQNRNLELTQTNNDLLNLLSSVQMAIVMLGPDLRIRRFTPAAERLLNLIASDVGRPMTDIKLNFAVPDLDAKLIDVIETVTTYEREVQDPQGHWYWLRLRPYRTVDNKIDGAVVVLVDIDSLKRAEAAVRESEGRFQMLADSSAVLIWVSNQSGAQFANRAYLEFLGLDERDVSDVHWSQFVHPADRAEFVTAFQEAMASGERFEQQCRFRRADGDYRWMKAVAVPGGATPSGEPAYVTCMIDVSDLKNAEDALRQADRSKNDFLAMLAHELRNPLAPIQNVVQLLQAQSDDPAVIPWARDVLGRQTRAMSRMIDDLLDVSRITRGKIQLREEVVDIRRVIDRAVEQLFHTMTSKQIQFRLEVVNDALLVDGDAIRLQQVIGNLLHNAIKFTPLNGHIALTADHIQHDGSPYVQIEIHDNGVGMSEELLDTIFDPFVQGDRSIERSSGGLGIGLTLVRTLVEQHGGMVRAQSGGPGMGSTFSVRIPASRAPGEAKHASPATRERVRSRNVLVVDDNIDASTTLGILLEHEGHRVKVLHHGSEVLHTAKLLRPDVVLLDIGLPGKNGYEVAEELRSDPSLGRQLLIAVTGYGGEEERARTTAAGFDAHLTKPVDFEQLQGLLDQ